MTDDPVPDLSTVASPPRRDLSYEDLDPGETIGRGGQAVVRRARVLLEGPPEYVALREPGGDDHTVDATVASGFVESIETWEKLDESERHKPRWADSEHVVGIVDTGDRLPWVAMELMDGGSLADRLEAAPGGLPLAEALWIGECVARGIELAHNSGVAHLDLKPSNVLFRATPGDQWDVPKIADWGLAESLIDASGEVAGLSPEYAAPEQFDPDTYGEPDTLTDVYGVGALLYALATGRPPYTGSRVELARAVCAPEGPRPPSERRPDLPAELDHVIERALAREKTDRHRSIGHLVEQLAGLRAELAGAGATREKFGADLRTGVEIPLQEAYEGVDKRVTFSRPQLCPDCGGDRESCDRCGGAALVEEVTTVEVGIPAGVADGQTLRTVGEGVPDPGGDPGDLLVEVSVDIGEFDRDGADLVYVLDAGEYTPGSPVIVPTVDSNLTLDLPADAEPGDTYRVEGEGMPRLREPGYGDLYVELGE